MGTCMVGSGAVRRFSDEYFLFEERYTLSLESCPSRVTHRLDPQALVARTYHTKI